VSDPFGTKTRFYSGNVQLVEARVKCD